MTLSESRMTLRIKDPDVDADALQGAAQDLRRLLLEFDAVADVAPLIVGPPPPGSRAGDLLAIAEMSVDLLGSKEVVAAILGAVGGWLGGRDKRSVELTIDGETIKLTGGRRADQQRLIEQWIRKHG